MNEPSRNDEMLNAARLLDKESESQDLVVLPHSAQMQNSSAVFAEPVVSAQPIAPALRRRVPEFMNRMKVLASMAGEDYRYQFPVKQKNGQKKIVEGGTIKMANDLVREYGNCMVDVRVVEQGDSHVFYARFIDYETGFCMTRPFRQRKSQKTMGDDPERAQDIIFQIGASKAIRNVVLNALGTFADFTYEEAKNSLIAKVGQNLMAWRTKIVEGCKERGYDLTRIERIVTKPVTEWLAVDIARVVAELKSVSDGMATFDELYPVAGTSAADLNSQFLNKANGANPTTQPPEGQQFTESSPTATKPKPEKTASEKLEEQLNAPKLTPEQKAVENLFATLEKMKPEERGPAFVAASGLVVIDKAGRTKQVDEAFKSIGIILPPTD